MAKEGATYVCDICQQIVVVQKSGVGTLVCCNQPMREYIEDQILQSSPWVRYLRPNGPTLDTWQCLYADVEATHFSTLG